MGTFLYRLMGAAVLDAGVYENVERDRHATLQAAAVVLLSSLAAGIGAGGIYGPRPSVVLAGAAIAVIVWISWAALTVQIGTRWLPETATAADLGQMLRTLGFAASPGLLQIFGVFPGTSRLVFAVSWLWMLAAMIVAVKHALDFKSGLRAAGVCVMAASVCVVMALVAGLLFGPDVS